jgi:ferrous iron transport protein A
MLNDLKPGQRARIHCHHTTGATRQRLLSLGFIPRAEVDVIRRAPFGDPIQCRVFNCCVTLSRSEAKLIEVDSEEETPADATPKKASSF